MTSGSARLLMQMGRRQIRGAAKGQHGKNGDGEGNPRLHRFRDDGVKGRNRPNHQPREKDRRTAKTERS
jgi:hypothetical protein